MQLQDLFNWDLGQIAFVLVLKVNLAKKGDIFT